MSLKRFGPVAALLFAACQPHSKRLLLVEYRRFYPHLTRQDLSRYRTIVVLGGREPEGLSDALTIGDLAILTDAIRRGGVVVLAYAGAGEGSLDRWIMNRWLSSQGAGIAIGTQSLEGPGVPLPRSALDNAGFAPFAAGRNHALLVRNQSQTLVGALLVVLLVGFLVPWPINVGGRFSAVSPLHVAVTAPEAGVVADVYAAEGALVTAGAPLVRLRSLTLDREAVTLRRRADSLAGREAIARVRGGGEASARHVAAERDEQAAKLGGVLARLRTLTLRAPVTGVVVTPRLAESVGRWLPRGAVTVRLDAPDGVELRVIPERAGATLVRPGQRAALISYADVGRPVRAEVASVSSAASNGGGTDALEARVRVTGDALLRPGVTGAAKVTVRRSNLFGALWWGIRKRVRSDLLL